MANWVYTLCQRGMPEVDITDLIDASGRALSVKLLDNSSATFTLNGYDPQVQLINELQTDLVITRNDVKIFRGTIGPSTDNLTVDGYTVTFTAWDYREVLNRAIVLEGDTVNYLNIEQELLGWNLINNYQNRDGGDLGISRNPNQQTGITRSVLLDAGQKVADQIDSLSQMDSGFEWDISPEMVYTVYYPLRGDQSGDFLLDWGGSLIGLNRTMDPSQYADVVRVEGGTATLPDPPVLHGHEVNTGGFFTRGDQYRYAVSAILPEGETKVSNELAMTITLSGASDNSVYLNWNAIPRATGYNVYGRNKNFGPTNGAAVQNNTTGGGLLGGVSYEWAITAITPNGETDVGNNISLAVTGAAGTLHKADLSWFAYPGATAYRVYGRNQSGTKQFIITTASTSYTDAGTIIPDGAPPVPFTMKKIASNVAGTSFTDGGISAPNGALPTGIPNPVVQIQAISGINTLAQGRWESQIGEPDIVYQDQITSKASYDLVQSSVIRPAYTCVVSPTKWNGPADLWLGDSPTLSVVVGRLNIHNTDLRVTEMDFRVSDEGVEQISLTLGYKSMNIFKKMRNVFDRLNTLERVV